ncbi:MAG: SGNH/GDSL hydrolase family protein [Ignavibacteriales bacterium]|nr:SGNH/GDSL hydrolase family protein [Ignavibacteriales bacterium]MCF8307267.1 SGNH/GDSL hydrolase family protein [Ignavibacteriales bacterium]MCF8438579.1 SGNH/GDSL hydrolase family protein [Ignavibacteriales bacterium]
MKLWLPFFSYAGFTFIVTILTVILSKSRQEDHPRLRKSIQNIVLVFLSLSYLFLASELIFGLLFIRSDGYGFTRAARLWSEKYWKPVNSQGYRDIEHSEWRDSTVFVVGDSFAAGHGIKNPADRFSEILRNKLDEKWSLVIMAKNGWHVSDYYEALISTPKKPDIIIVSYLINDIENAAVKSGYSLPNRIQYPSEYIKPFIEYSFTLNWFYWQVFRANFGNVYWDYLIKAFQQPEVWQEHKKEILGLINFSRKNNCRLYFVLWPEFSRLNESENILAPVSEFLAQNGIDVVDLAPVFAQRDPYSMTVNKYDSHPNEIVNKEAAEIIYTRLFGKP